MSNLAALSIVFMSQFGSEGTMVPSGQITLAHITSHDGNGSYTNFTIAPEVSYFVIENLAVGAGLAFGLGVGPNVVSYNYGAHPTVGYYLPFSETLGLFPKIGLSYAVQKLSNSIPGIGTPLNATISESTVSVDVSAPVLVHHGSFFFGFGPSVSRRLTGTSDYYGRKSVFGAGPYVIAFASTIGGWF